MTDDFEQRLRLADSLAKAGKLREAAACYQAIVRQRPDPHALHNLAVVLGQLGHTAAATEALEATVKLRPDFAEAWRNLGVMYSRVDRIDDALAAYQPAVALAPDFPVTHSSLLLMSLFRDAGNPEKLAAAHRRFGERFADPLTSSAPPHENDFDPNRRLRIGYVSPDFHAHSVAFFIEPVLALHRPGEVETFCYSDVREEDNVTARLKRRPAHWRDVQSLDHDQLAAQIRADRIDILVDLAGHTGNNRLLTFARKPAPVQVSYLGYAATSGIKAIDYRITDAFADPPGATEQFWTEKLIRLPRTAWCYRPPADAPEPVIRDAGPITFGCFARTAKLSPHVMALWNRIVARVPGARLLLRRDMPPAGNVREYMGRYQQLDIALDTFPYHGTTTTLEALCMGVPVITRAGDSHISRVGVSLLSNAGLPELIATSDDAYIELAVALACDRARLSALRHDLRQRMKASPLMDEAAYVADLEQVYRTIWTDACDRADQSRRGRQG